MCKHCQTEAESKECLYSKMGTNVEFIIAQSMVQHNNKGGLRVAREDQIAMAAIDSPRGPHVLLQTVRGDHMLCHRQSGGTTFRGDQLKYDSIRSASFRSRDAATGLNFFFFFFFYDINLTPFAPYFANISDYG